MGKLDKAREEIAQAEAHLTEARLRLAQAEAENYPPEELRSGAVVQFDVEMDVWNGRRKTYRYAAIRVGSRWFTTGSTCPPNGFAWRELIDWIRVKQIRDTPILTLRPDDGPAWVK